jgi:release factor glutamine methyltransferase
MRLRDWRDKGEVELRAGPHPERARPDAETLLLHLVGKNKAWLLSNLEDDLAGCTAIRYAALLERRLKGEPIQYITGETEFYGLAFRVTSDVLIPRPETEHLVEKVIELAARFSAPRIVDVGTGSGAIAVALAHKLPEAQVAATDLSESALAIARENAERNGLTGRIHFLQGELLEPLSTEKFDIVVSNPPYVPTEDRDTLTVEVRDYEPPLALFAGNDGLDVYRRLIPAAHAALVQGGFLALEIGFGQANGVRALLKDADYGSVDFASDLQGIARVAIASWR